MIGRGVARFLVVVLCVVAPGLVVSPASVAADPIVEGVVSFADVPESSLFHKEISWLAAAGVSTGWEVGAGSRQYRPLDSIARDAMAAFLYRRAGSPAYTPPTSSPFTDVTPGVSFYKEITWLASQGISTGWDIGAGRREYRPLDPIARDAMAAFLFRFAKPGEFTAPAQSPFVDVAAGGDFYKEIAWLASSGISTGWDIGAGVREYRPLNGIARDAMAAFLYRHASEVLPTNPLDPAAGTVRIAPDVEVLEPSQLNTATVSEGALTLPSSEAAAVNANDVLVAGVTPGTPEGLLARVVQVSRDPGGNTVVSLKPATIPEAIVSTSGVLEVAGTPASSTFTPEPDVTVTTEGSGVAPLSKLAQPEALVAGEVFSESFSLTRTIKSEAVSDNLSGNGSITFDSSIKASARAKMTLEAGFLQLKEASVVLTPSLSSRHSVSVSGTLEGTASAKLGVLKAIIVFPTAIPVVVTAEAEVAVNLSAAGTAEISYVTAQTISSDVGFKYREGAFNLVKTKPQATGVLNEVQASASLTARLGLDFDADIRFYGIAGMTFGAGPYASAPIAVVVAGGASTWSCPIEMGYETRLGVVAGIEVMGFKLEGSDGISATWKLFEANPCENTPVVSPAPHATPSPIPAPTPSPTPVGGDPELIFLTTADVWSGMFSTPSVSGDGRYVAFTSTSADAHAKDQNAADDVYLKDTLTGGVHLVSAGPLGESGDAISSEPVVSADGRHVAFLSVASNLVSVEDVNAAEDVFIRNLEAGRTALVSVNSSGLPGNGPSWPGSVSADGRFVAFFSDASDLVVGDTNQQRDVFVRDMHDGVTRLVSVATAGSEANGRSTTPSISADGRFVAFSSGASNLVPEDSNNVDDVFLRDMAAGTTRLVSTPSPGQSTGRGSGGVSLSANGRFVAFHSFNENHAPSVFLRDMETESTRLVSETPAGSTGEAFSVSPSVSADGRYVAFTTAGLDMVSGASKQAEDIYLRDMSSGALKLVSKTPAGAPSDESHLLKSISADGHYVVFSSIDPELRPADTRSGIAVYRARVLAD